MAGNFQFDFDYEFRPEYAPVGCDIRPWFLMTDPGYPASDDYWVYALRYRAEKIDWVRRQLAGVDRPAALREISRRILQGARNDREKYEKLIHFVQRMMFHPPIEQPLERNAVKTLRHDTCGPTDHGEPYPEDLAIPWTAPAFEEARKFGRHIGIWCSRLGQKLGGDWGLRGVVHDALELLMLHEGRCGHQAMVVVQLAHAGGMRARLVQGVSHRYSELMVDGRWVLADTDIYARGFVPRTPAGEIPTLEWCRDNPGIVNSWPTLERLAKGAAAYYGAAPQQ